MEQAKIETIRRRLLEHYRKYFGNENGRLQSRGDVEVISWQDPDQSDTEILTTLGMSARPGTSAANTQAHRVELMVYASQEDSLRLSTLLLDLSEYPAAHNTSIYWYHVIPLGMPIVSGSTLTSVYLSFPPIEREAFSTIGLDDERVDLLWVVPISESERQLFIGSGADALEVALERKGAVVSDLHRTSVA